MTKGPCATRGLLRGPLISFRSVRPAGNPRAAPRVGLAEVLWTTAGRQRMPRPSTLQPWHSPRFEPGTLVPKSGTVRAQERQLCWRRSRMSRMMMRRPISPWSRRPFREV